jgi:SAM-dependent methyltransferase
MIKNFAKKIIPMRSRRFIRRLEKRIFGLDYKYKNMSNEHLFDSIYLNHIWGTGQEGNGISGSGSHEQYIVGPYVNAVREILRENKIETIVDLGCGDFNVGSQFVDCCVNYVACDISKTIIEINKKRFNSKKVEFRQLDLTMDKLPSGEIGILRQVLQHLSNADIKRFVARLNQEQNFKYLLVTEHLPDIAQFEPNLDKRSGPNIRIDIKSGVILHEPPFLLRCKSAQEILLVRKDVNNIPAVIKTTFYKF